MAVKKTQELSKKEAAAENDSKQPIRFRGVSQPVPDLIAGDKEQLRRGQAACRSSFCPKHEF